MPLKRTLHLPMVIFYGTGMILGAGIYSILGQAAGRAGEGLWQAFLLAAVTALLTALSYAELSALFPKVGGEYVYLRNVFASQRWIAGTTGILIVFSGCATAATVSLAFASYLNRFVEFSPLAVATALLVLFSAVNLIGIQQSSWVNAVFTLIEAGGLIVFIVLGWTSEKFGSALSVAPSWPVVSSAAIIVFAYFGFENIVNLSEETKHPEKTVPRAILWSVAITTVLYVMVSLSAVALMPPDQLAQTDSALAAAAMSRSRPIANILGGIALFSTANTALISLIAASRVLYAISRDRSLPQVFSRTLRRHKTPWVAGLSVLGVSLLLLLVGQVDVLAGIASFSTMVAFVVVNMALIVLRFKQPHRPRTFRVPISVGRLPILPVLGVGSSVLLLFQFDLFVYGVGIAALTGSALLYAIARFASGPRRG